MAGGFGLSDAFGIAKAVLRPSQTLLDQELRALAELKAQWIRAEETIHNPQAQGRPASRSQLREDAADHLEQLQPDFWCLCDRLQKSALTAGQQSTMNHILNATRLEDLVCILGPEVLRDPVDVYLDKYRELAVTLCLEEDRIKLGASAAHFVELVPECKRYETGIWSLQDRGLLTPAQSARFNRLRNPKDLSDLENA